MKNSWNIREGPEVISPTSSRGLGFTFRNIKAVPVTERAERYGNVKGPKGKKGLLSKTSTARNRQAKVETGVVPRRSSEEIVNQAKRLEPPLSL
jgi:hypothetical protein